MKPVPLTLALMAVAVTTIGAVQVQTLVIYNPSQSVPSGFYLRANSAPQLGAFVTVASVDVAPEYVAQRGYADRTDLFLKRVVATEGQLVCAADETVSIDGMPIVSRMTHDGDGRELPTWRGCHTLGAGEYFLLGDTNDSFDGRYWGPTRRNTIDGVWTRL